MIKKLVIIPLLFISTLTFADPIISEGKCTNDTESILNEMLIEGYQPLIVSKDLNNVNISHIIAFNMQANRMLSYSNYHKNDKIEKICFDYVGITPNGNGPVFKDFILHQHIDKIDKEQNEYDKNLKKRSEEEHDPYQGNPFIANFRN